MLPLLRRARHRLRKLIGAKSIAPEVGSVRWGDLRRATPISRKFGYDRGGPVDRHYVERFLSHWSADVHGRVLEIKDSTYTRRFGSDRVVASEVLDIDPANPAATIVADLNRASELPDAAFDCIILTQTLQFIYDFRSALGHLHRALKDGGVLLVTVPGITPVRTGDMSWYWSFTNLSVERLLTEHFARDNVEVSTYGNLLSATAFLYGLSGRELSARELEREDADYPVIVAARAKKARS